MKFKTCLKPYLFSNHIFFDIFFWYHFQKRWKHLVKVKKVVFQTISFLISFFIKPYLFLMSFLILFMFAISFFSARCRLFFLHAHRHVSPLLCVLLETLGRVLFLPAALFSKGPFLNCSPFLLFCFSNMFVLVIIRHNILCFHVLGPGNWALSIHCFDPEALRFNMRLFHVLFALKWVLYVSLGINLRINLNTFLEINLGINFGNQFEDQFGDQYQFWDQFDYKFEDRVENQFEDQFGEQFEDQFEDQFVCTAEQRDVRSAPLLVPLLPSPQHSIRL